jgi:hypothetical protein
MKTQFTCSQCGETKEHSSDITTGYARDAQDNKICFACCGKNDYAALENAKVGDKLVYYLSSEEGKHTLSNWPGTMVIRLHSVRKGRHNIAGKRYDFWFDYKGNNFHGVQYGDNTQIAHIKRIKS